MEKVFTEEDQQFFTSWINLDFEAISWEGRYLEDFNLFWHNFIKSELTLNELFERFKNASSNLSEGPLIAWINWLQEKLTIYTFVFKGFSIKEISDISGRRAPEVATILRKFFVERLPHLEEPINEKFNVGTILSENLHVSFKTLSQEFSLNKDELKGTLDNEVLNSLEVTLYSEWKVLSSLFASHKDKKNNITNLKSKFVLKQQLKFMQELAVLFIIGGLLIFVVKVGNKWYEDYLEKKISLFEPNFFWLDKDLSFKGEKVLGPDDISVSLDQLEELEKIESKNVFEDASSNNRYEVETDVVLTSIDALPKDFDVADLEQSNYEEIKKGGFRNNRYGRRKAYRVLLTSVNPKVTKSDLINILNSYEIEQVDNVKPGTEIPGGIYFNLNVPAPFLKEFLLKVSAVEESVILESKTVSRGPAGTNRVFIWIKSI